MVDHTEPGWAARYSRSHVRQGRENGAATYSREIVAHHIPVWRQVLPAGSVVASCPLLTGLDVRGEVAVQYLHTYSYLDPLGQAREVAGWMAGRCSRLVFVTAYRSLALRLEAAGFEALFVPMSIDVDRVRAHASVPEHEHGRAVYFGNVTRSKVVEHRRTVGILEARGWVVDVLSDGCLNGRKLTQGEAWRQVSRYRYGIGVGRCALEMQALGLRVLVSGAEFGGLATTEGEWLAQRATNWNGRVVTFDRDPGACVDAWPSALVADPPDPAMAVAEISRWAVRSGTAGGVVV